jgi:hypothetical protein
MKLLYGFELETIINSDKLEFDIDGYHEHNLRRGGLRLESDSSIENCCPVTGNNSFDEDKFSTGVVEVITPPFQIEEFDNVWGNIMYYLNPEGIESGRMNELIAFNGSTGCHVHVSMNNRSLSSTFNIALCKEIYDKTCSHMKRLLGSNYALWKNQCFRSYAPYCDDYADDRCWVSVRRQTLEFRFFHLLGVTTFDQAKTAIRGFLNILEATITTRWEQEKHFINEEISVPLKKKRLSPVKILLE